MVFLSNEMSKTNLPVFAVTSFIDEVTSLSIDVTETNAWFDDCFRFFHCCTNKVVNCCLFWIS